MGSVDSNKLRATDFELGDDYGISNPVTRAAIQKGFAGSLPAEIDEEDLVLYPDQFTSLVKDLMGNAELSRNRIDTEKKLVEYQNMNKQNSANLNNRRSTMARKTAFDKEMDELFIAPEGLEIGEVKKSLEEGYGRLGSKGVEVDQSQLDDLNREFPDFLRRMYDLEETEKLLNKYKPERIPAPLFEELNKQNSAKLVMNRYLKKVAASVEEKILTQPNDPSKLKLSREQAERVINSANGLGGFSAGPFSPPTYLESDPEKVVSGYANEQGTWDDKTKISGVDAQTAIKRTYDAYNKGRINLSQFNKLRDMLNVQEELEAQGRRVNRDDFAKIPSTLLEEDGRRLTPEERALFNLYNKELLPGYDKAYAPANFKKQNSSQLVMNRYLKKVAATAVVIERKTAALDPRKMKRLMMLLGGLAGAGGIAAGVNSARPGMMEEYWGNAGDELVGNPTQASVMEDDSQNAANLADTEAKLMGEYAGAATDVARNNAKSQKQRAYEQALAAYGDVNKIPFEVLQDIDAQYQQNVDSGNRKYDPVNAVAPKGTGKGSGIMGADLTDFDKLMAEGGYN